MADETARLFKEDDYAIHLQRVSSSSDEGDLEWASDSEEFDEYGQRRHSSLVHTLTRRILPKVWAAITCVLSWRRIVEILRPSFFPGGDGEEEKSRGGANGALDGLRGVACLIVAFYHYFGEFFELDKGYIWDEMKAGGGQLATWWNLPYIKWTYNGPNMVAVFFAISGYVLSHRFIDLSRRGNSDRALGSMPSAIFRRWMRLFLPVGASFALTCFLVQCGMYEYSREQHQSYGEIGYRLTPFPRREETVWEQMWLWLETWRHLFMSFTWERFGPVDIDPDAWTISVEYRSSIVIFMTAIALAKVKKLFVRLGFIVLIMAWALQWEQRAWEVTLFLGGMFVAEINVAKELEKEANEGDGEKRRGLLLPSQHWWIAGMLVILYCASVPSLHLYDEDPGLGWHMLRDIAFIPNSYIFNMYNFLGATLSMAAATNWDPLLKLLNMSVPQYLGRLSFALYLVHGPWLKFLAWATVPRFYNVIYGHLGSPDRDFIASTGVGFLVFLPTTIYLADMFMRFVDVPSVKLSRWIWDKCTS